MRSPQPKIPIQVLMSIALFITAAMPVQAQMSDGISSWIDGPAGFLVTEEERQSFINLPNDEQAEEFIDLFWAKRDPDLSTEINEFKFEYDARVELADKEFSTEKDRGALAPQGKVLILLGFPDRHGRMKIGDYLAALYEIAPPEPDAKNINADATMQGVTFNRVKGMADAWAYTAETLPEGVYEGDGEVIFAFFDSHGIGAFRLQSGIRRAQEAEDVLSKAPAALIVNPDLTEVPAFSSLAGVSPATAEQLSVLDGETVKWPEDSVVTRAQGIASADNHPNWISALLPEGLAEADVVVGRVMNNDGSLIASLQLPVTPIVTALGTAYSFSFPATEKQTKLDFVLLSGVLPVAGTSLALEFEESELGKVHFSQVFAGAEVSSAKDAVAGDAFVFGGYQLVPRPEGRYVSSDNLSLFCLATVPDTVGPEGKNVKIRMRWYINGRPAPSSQPQSVTLLPAGPGVWVWGTQLPLSSMSPGTEYRLKVTISSADDSISRTTEVPVLMRAVIEE